MFHLFRKDIEKHCAYCKSGSVINEGQVICSRRAWSTLLTTAVTSATIRSSVCRPVPPTLNDQYTSEDFSCKAGQRPEQ